jgi:hypothetical protein
MSEPGFPTHGFASSPGAPAVSEQLAALRQELAAAEHDQAYGWSWRSTVEALAPKLPQHERLLAFHECMRHVDRIIQTIQTTPIGELEGAPMIDSESRREATLATWHNAKQRALEVFAALLPPSNLVELLGPARALAPEYRAPALAALALHTPAQDALLEELLEALKHVAAPFAEERVIRELLFYLPRLPAYARREIILKAQAISADAPKSRILADIIQHLPEAERAAVALAGFRAASTTTELRWQDLRQFLPYLPEREQASASSTIRRYERESLLHGNLFTPLDEPAAPPRQDKPRSTPRSRLVHMITLAGFGILAMLVIFVLVMDLI